MKKIWRWCLLLLAVLLTLLGALISIKNFHLVSLDLFFKVVEQPLIVFLVGAFLSGLLVSWSLYAWLLFQRKQKIKQLSKQLADYKQEVSQLRQSPMSGM